MSAVVLGATGLCGRAFLKYCESSQELSEVCTITRRALPFKSSAEQKVDEDSTKWGQYFPDKNLKFVFTGLATTRADAGGLDKQYAIDHDLNIELAKVAKKKGCSTFVLVSSEGAKDNSMFGYLKMKGEIERDILALGFDHTVILRPGPILGERPESRGFASDFITKFGPWLYGSRLQCLVGYPVYGDDIGRVGVHLALEEAGANGKKVRIVESKEIFEIAGALRQ